VIAAGCRFGFTTSTNEIGDRDAGTATPDTLELDAFVEPNVVFVTSMPVVMTTLASRAAADAHCQAAADSVGLAGTYVAWVSTIAEPARLRIGNARGWVRMDGKPVIDDMATTLATGRIWNPIAFDELGAQRSGQGFQTGTAPDGNVGFNCNDWTNTAGSTTMADAGGGTQSWTSVFGQIAVCNQNNMGLLCFGVDRVARVEPPAEQGRKAFISDAPWIPSSGRADADARCQADAMAAGVPGSFKALLSTTTSPAISRFNTTTPWVRVDGVLVGSDLTRINAPVNVTASGTYIDDILNWSGATSISATPALADNCSNWSLTTGSSWIGRASRSGGSLFGGGTGGCGSTTNRIWCLEE
jgi:hypothetical protein